MEDTVPRASKNTFDNGFTMIENRLFTQGRYLTADAKVAYAALKSFQNKKTGLCYPSYDKIMERSGLTRPRLAKAIAELEEFSWLTKKKRFSGSTFYQLDSPTVYELDDEGERAGLFHDQTCPSKKQAEARRKRRKSGRRVGWIDMVMKESKRLELQEAEWEDEIPF